MFGLSKQPELNVLVLRDADLIAAAVSQALADAKPEERPGLERAAGLVARVAGEPDNALRARWVRERLAAAGYEGAPDPSSSHRSHGGRGHTAHRHAR